MKTEPFKICTGCNYRWNDAKDLIRDRNLLLNGYQAAFTDACEGLFLLTHRLQHCGTTLAIPASALADFCDVEKHAEELMFTAACEGRCSQEHDLDPCSNACSMRWVRDIIQLLKKHGNPAPDSPL